tara:strand:+ start:2121 stop:2618 length:498 start_codon:yes stop_codon:yes gene_type:complete
MSELRNLLKSISFGDLQGTQINNAGKIAFADIIASKAVQEIIDIGNAWKTVTMPSYGSIVPQTCEVLNVELEEATETILAPSGNEVYEIMGFSLIESAGASATVNITIEDDVSGNVFVPFTSEGLTSGQRKTVQIKNFRIDSNNTMKATVTGGMQINVLVGKVAL